MLSEVFQAIGTGFSEAQGPTEKPPLVLLSLELWGVCGFEMKNVPVQFRYRFIFNNQPMY